MGSFNENLRLLRKKNDMTQADLAKKLGISSSAVAMYERGEREPNFDTLKNIGVFFNVDMNYLLGMYNDERSYQNADNKEDDQVREEQGAYHINVEAKEIAKYLSENPEHKILFDDIKDLKKDDIEFVKKMIEKIK
jgi:transcriptional regulator with XRE-family HTH domain